MHKAAIDRVKLIFALLDADGTGSLETEDFELMATRVVAASPDSGDAG